MISKHSLSICTALTLAFAIGTASAAETISRKGFVPQVGNGDTAKSADVIMPGASFGLGVQQAPKAASPEGPEMMIQGLSGIKHGRDGTNSVIDVPAKLQMMLKSRGEVKPVKPPKGKLVQIKNTKVSPYASMGMVMTGCSGALVMNRFVLTAPWCVYDVKAKKFYENLDFIPALNGNDAPVGTVKWKNVWIPKGFQETGDLAYAFAMIELEQNIGEQVGWFGFGPVQGSESLKQMTLTGYPFVEGVPQNTLWETTCKIDANEENAYFYRCPGKGSTLVTMLGAPFFAKGAKEGDAGQLLGIHITSQNDKLDSWWAMKLTEAHTQTLLAWANGGESPPEEPDEPEEDEEEDVADGGTGDEPACTCEDPEDE